MGNPKDGEFTCRECGKTGFPSGKAVGEHRKTDCPGNPLAVENKELKEELEAMKALHTNESIYVSRINELENLVDELRNNSPPEKASIEAIQRMAGELEIGFILVENSRFLVIPTRFLPDETKYLGVGKYMGIKARGYLGKDGLVVQENVELIR